MDGPADAAEAYLLDYHRDHAGATTRAFARGRTQDGLSSYEHLAEIAEAAARPGDSGLIVDLACGDGYLLERARARGVPAARLVGVDMSPEELALARARPALDGVRLVQERAQRTSLEHASAACVVSHMAFMLMRPVEPVVAEIARVLRPGGEFAAVVGGGPRTDREDAFTVFLGLFVPLLDHALGLVTPRLGDPRTRSDAGLAELFSPAAGFEPPAIRDLELALDGTLDEVWALMSTIYEAHRVPPAEMAALRDRFAARVAPLARAGGVLPCCMWLRLIRCRRAA